MEKSVDFFCGVTTTLISLTIGFGGIHILSDGEVPGLLVPCKTLMIMTAIVYAYTFLLARADKKRDVA